MRIRAAVTAAVLSMMMAAAVGGRAQEPDADPGTALVPEPVDIIQEPVPPVPPFDFHRNDALWAARLCVHEATWAGREGGTSDCGGIVQVILNRMSEGESFEEQLSETAPRFWAGTTTRSWVLHLVAGPIRSNPPGWPTNWPLASNYSESWHSVYRRTVAFMQGHEPLPCGGRAQRWFGRRADAARLAEILAEGRWVEVECAGEGDLQERNAFLERVVVEEPAEDELVGG